MKIAIVLLSSLLVAGCVAYPDYSSTEKTYMEPLYRRIIISPSVAPDGSKSFTAVSWNKLPKNSPPELTVEKWHAHLIGTELARQKLCMNGYSYKKSTAKTIDGQIVYLGKCK